MSTARKKKPEPAKPGTQISKCHIEMHQQVSDKAVEAAQALASAAQANAVAIAAIAEILKPSKAPSYGIYLQGA
jgi:hypothetical protein